MIIFTGVIILSAAVVAAVIFLHRVLRGARPVPLDKADAIVVFGADVWPDGRPSRSLQIRVARAAEVYKEGWAPVLLCSGGWSNGRSEAAVMRRMLMADGIPAGAVIPDDGGTTTRQTFRTVRRFCGSRWRRIIAVSSAYHMHRIGREAERQGIHAILCPAVDTGPPLPGQRKFLMRQYMRETMAVPSYAIKWHIVGWLQRGWRQPMYAAWRQLSARLAALTGEVDSVARAGDLISRRIKTSRIDFSDTAAVRPPEQGLRRPVNGTVGDRFGLRHRRLHSGIDIRSLYGERVLAAADGKVIIVDNVGPYGNVAVIDHEGGLATVYGHLCGFVVAEGDSVRAGQQIGYIGETGRAFGPHLHFEVRVHGSPVDPLVYLEDR